MTIKPILLQNINLCTYVQSGHIRAVEREMIGLKAKAKSLDFVPVLERCAYIYEVDFLRFSWNGRRSFGRYGNGRWHADNPLTCVAFGGGADGGTDRESCGVFAYWCSCPRGAFEEQTGGA